MLFRSPGKSQETLFIKNKIQLLKKKKLNTLCPSEESLRSTKLGNTELVAEMCLKTLVMKLK